MRNDRGVFIAAPHVHYDACWIRDQLYCTLSYLYTKDHLLFAQGMHVVFDILHKHRGKVESVVGNLPTDSNGFIHAKVKADTLEEFEPQWGHHQVDAIGLFLFMVALAKERGVKIFRNTDDRDLIQLLVFYLAAVRYWEIPDNGMWEEALDVHTSSVGAAVAGLKKIQNNNVVFVPQALIEQGESALQNILPNECLQEDRDVDMAQLSLIWPYNVVTNFTRDEVLRRVEEKLVQKNGLNRYWGDEYYCSDNGVSAEWPMGFFWLSIIYANISEKEKAHYWFKRGKDTITEEGYIPEAYQNDKPNDHTPLAWAHSMAIIASTFLDAKK